MENEGETVQLVGSKGCMHEAGPQLDWILGLIFGA